jgi:hypothetical protein
MNVSLSVAVIVASSIFLHMDLLTKTKAGTTYAKGDIGALCNKIIKTYSLWFTMYFCLHLRSLMDQLEQPYIEVLAARSQTLKHTE